MLAQLPQLQPGELERWLISAAAAGGIVLVWSKLFGKNGKGEFVTREEFREFRASVESELTLLRDRIDARHVVMVQALESSRSAIIEAGERRGSDLAVRLGLMEAALARLDERTKEKHD